MGSKLRPDRVTLGNEVFEGRNNAYVLDGEPTTLVDTGASIPSVEDDLTDGLSALGLSYSDVDQIVLTHRHADHAGLAGAIQDERGATVYAHAADAPFVEGDEETLAAERRRFSEAFDEWGMPAGPRAELEAFFESTAALGGEPAAVTTVEDGDTIAIDGGDLEVVHLPGHTAGLVAYAFDGEQGREAFVGDAILPKYTPNVGGADVLVDRPLGQYVESLLEIVDRDWALAWPGHRDPIDDPAARAATILEHHRLRTDRVVGVLRDHGPADAWTVSAHLFGDLEKIHILHGPGEAYAHLDHLEREGVVAAERVEPDDDSVDADGDRLEYRLLDPDASADDLFPAVDSEVARRASDPRRE